MNRLRWLKAGIVAAVARLLYVTGLLHIALNFATRKRAVVLMYHRVIAPDERDATFSHPGILVDTPTFEQHLRLLRKHFRVLTVNEFARCMERGEPFPARSCLVTFDDGWIDNYTRAFPLLKKYDVPAVIFLPCGYIGTGRRFWQETLARALHRALREAQVPVHRRLLDEAGLTEPYPEGDAQTKAVLVETVERIKSAAPEARQSLLEAASAIVAGGSATASDIDAFVTWDQVREMAAGGISFGSHTTEHELLTQLPDDRVRFELGGSKQTIEQALRRPVVAFAYPNGDHDTRTCRAVAESGYAIAFTTQPGRVEPQDDRYRIRRINVHQGSAASAPLLIARMAGVL